jgi:hypothetical protein
MKITLKLQKLVCNITKFSEGRYTMDDPDASGRFTIYDLRYTIYDIRSRRFGTMDDGRYSDQFSGISVQYKLNKCSSIERSEFLLISYMTYMVQIYLTTKSTKPFVKLRMTAQSLTKI